MAARTSTTRGAPSRATSAGTTARSASTSPRSSATRALRIGALGWDDIPADAQRPGPDARPPSRRHGRGRGRPEFRPRLSARQLRHDRGTRRPDRGGRSCRRLLPHARALPAGRPLPRPVPRGDRDRPAGRRPGPHHPLLPPPDAPGRTGRAAGAGRRRARRRPRCHLRYLSVRVGEHAPPDPAAGLDPGRRTRTAEAAPRRRDRARPDSAPSS